MADFSNVNRAKSFLRPSYGQIDLFIAFNSIENIKSMFAGKWTYKVKIFCSIPIVVFKCPGMDCNILLHLNLHALGSGCWLENDRLTFMLIISDVSDSNNVVGAKTICLSKRDSDRIRAAVSKQKNLSYQSIEDLVDIIYQLDIENIWPGSGEQL